MPEALEVFLSHAEPDADLLEEMLQHLSPLRRTGQIKISHARSVEFGDRWREQVEARLNSADLIVLLVSAAFIDSDDCWDVEAQRALERHRQGTARVVALLARPCDWAKTPLRDLPLLPQNRDPVSSWETRDGAWTQVVQELSRLLEELERPIHPEPPSSRENETWQDPLLGLEFRFLPPASFLMGSHAEEVGRYEREVLHRVDLTRGFWLSTTPVRLRDYRGFTKDQGNPIAGSQERDDHPMVGVDWGESHAFCEWLSDRLGERIRLPTEAEWEYAARAGTATATYAGDLTLLRGQPESALESIAWYRLNSQQSTQPVGLKEPNGFGLWDMLGNVREWTADIYGPLPQEPVQDPTGPVEGRYRILRGGGWDSRPRYCRSAFRDAGAPDSRLPDVGFRIVRAATE